ncbi:hypothetical protein B0T22DRAFT_490364 [Podospora appendiculata]|uniref:RING-type domain-containing protein n=1 Tax=Podospora appendiculata TaxID=314037 RepID=A0AAE0X9U7_9PEZI|nr:hypothetical protein B0T22DRAFT_490364 [Podospora appendiculata]
MSSHEGGLHATDPRAWLLGRRPQPSLVTDAKVSDPEDSVQEQKDVDSEKQEEPNVEEQSDSDSDAARPKPPRHEESKWQPIFEYLIKSEESRKSFSIPYAKCPMCLEEIGIPGIPLAFRDCWQEKGGYLPCGHMVCNLCFSSDYATIVTTRTIPRRPHACVVCRTSLAYPVCCHVITPIPIDKWYLQRARRTARLKVKGEWTPPEGDHLPDICQGCTENPGSKEHFLWY